MSQIGLSTSLTSFPTTTPFQKACQDVIDLIEAMPVDLEHHENQVIARSGDGKLTLEIQSWEGDEQKKLTQEIGHFLEESLAESASQNAHGVEYAQVYEYPDPKIEFAMNWSGATTTGVMNGTHTV